MDSFFSFLGQPARPLLQPWPAGRPKPPSPPSQSPTNQPSGPLLSLTTGPVHLRPPQAERPSRAPPLPSLHRRTRGAMPPPLLPPLNHSHYHPPLNQSFMALKSPFMPAARFFSDAGRYRRPTPSPSPYKRGTFALEHPAPLTIPLSSSPTSEHSPTEHRPPPVIPLHHAAVSPPPELR
jgi:hypothetical protein